MLLLLIVLAIIYYYLPPMYNWYFSRPPANTSIGETVTEDYGHGEGYNQEARGRLWEAYLSQEPLRFISNRLTTEGDQNTMTVTLVVWPQRLMVRHRDNPLRYRTFTAGKRLLIDIVVDASGNTFSAPYIRKATFECMVRGFAGSYYSDPLKYFLVFTNGSGDYDHLVWP